MNTLRQIIEEEIRQRGPIPFSRYMELGLYAPELGYYSRNAEQFGKAGDFYTSSDVHAVFGRLLARQFDEMWRALEAPKQINLVELGPGRGLFAQDVLGWSQKKFPDFFDAVRYVLVERSPALRARLQTTLDRYLKSEKAQFAEVRSVLVENSAALVEPASAAKRRKSAAHGASRGPERIVEREAPEGRKKIAHGATFSAAPAIIFANEFFDALPVEILGTQGSLRVDTRAGRFFETWAPASREELEFLDRYSVQPEPGERIEATLAAQCYLDDIAEAFHQGFVLLIDYGYTRAEQLAGRHRGTLKAIRRHSVSANPYETPGEQDITADVNFTALAAACLGHGMQVQKLITQSHFLLGIGEANQFADAFEDCRLPQERAKRALQLKHLVTPAGMGESFHVLAASKGIGQERIASLSGLNFGSNRAIR